MGSGCDGVGPESLAALLAVATAALSERNHFLPRGERGQRSTSVREVFVDERRTQDSEEGEYNF